MNTNGNTDAANRVEQPISPKAEVPKIQPMRRPTNVTALSVLGLFILALFYTFYLARDFFLPVVLAWMLSMLLKPVVRGLGRFGMPAPASAALILIGLISVLLAAGLYLTEPATAWLQQMPQQFEKMEAKVRQVLKPAEKLSKAAEKVENLAAQGETDTQTQKVEIKESKLLGRLLNQTRSFAYLFVETFVLLFFLLASGDLFMLKLVQALPRLRDKKRAVEIARESATGVSQYLVGMTMVNIAEGTMIGIGLWLLGMPNPHLWGVVAALANYIPYLGALAACAVVTLVAFASFESSSQALAAPAIYLGVNFLDNFLTPYILGRRLVLNPLVVFLAVMFWGWIWGIIGVLLAVPITMTVKVFCDHIPTLAPFGEFLSGTKTEDPTLLADKESQDLPAAEAQPHAKAIP